ncbi:transposase-like zinc-binding domain-containing protein [Flagellimonas oceani]
MEKKRCPNCNGYAIKNGKQKGNQRYKCKLCQKSF